MRYLFRVLLRTSYFCKRWIIYCIFSKYGTYKHWHFLLIFCGEGDISYNCLCRSPLQSKDQNAVMFKKRNCKQWSGLWLYPPLDTITSQLHMRPVFSEAGRAQSAQRRATGRMAEVLNPEEEREFSTPQRPDLLWGLPSLLHNGVRGLFPRW
jgi:hypothetical protein